MSNESDAKEALRIVRELENRVSGHHVVLHGKEDSLDGGLITLATSLGRAVFGGKNEPGIAAEVRSLKKVVWMGAGALAVIDLLIRIYVH